jgi:PKD repeat protein
VKRGFLVAETPPIKKPKKIKKRRLAVFIIFLLIFFITVGYFNNYLPPPQGLLNLLEPKTTAIPAVPLSGDAASLGFQLNKPLVADFSSAPEGESPLILQFLDQSRGNPERWDWNFGDTTSSTLQHPVHQYTVPGN